MKASNYIPSLGTGTEVRLTGLPQHAKNGDQGTILRVLPNPSKRRDNQWYDVRFPDGSIGRFQERYLVRITANNESRAA
jgi:hypothetical protein